jgi:hypothetical protein
MLHDLSVSLEATPTNNRGSSSGHCKDLSENVQQLDRTLKHSTLPSHRYTLIAATEAVERLRLGVSLAEKDILVG